MKTLKIIRDLFFITIILFACMAILFFRLNLTEEQTDDIIRKYFEKNNIKK
jgi:hypothetical protein